MKHKLLVLLVILTAAGAAGLWAWSQRFELALNHVREKGDSPDILTSIAWSTLGDFDDRPELEAFVRQQLVQATLTAPRPELHSPYEHELLLGLSWRVYARQPERVDASIVAAGLVLECLRGCLHFDDPVHPGFESPHWMRHREGSESFRTGMRLAAVQLAKLRFENPWEYSTDSYAALASALAEDTAEPDPELARSVASFILAANPGERDTDWLAAALERIAGPDGAAAAWTAGLAEAPGVEINHLVWNRAIDALKRTPAPGEEAATDALLTQCARRSAPPRSVDDACIDLGLAWGPAWATRLKAAASRGGSDANAARALLATHERESARTWQSVIAEWRMAEPSPPEVSFDARGRRVSAMELMAGRSGLARHRLREADLLMAAGAPAFPAVEAQYRASRNLDVVTTAALVLSRRAPQRLASAVMERIEGFRPLAHSFVRDSIDFDQAAYFHEGGRVALGLLVLEQHAEGTSRIHPLILALSIPEPGFSEHASAVLRRTLTADEFADALFGFLAVRERYLVTEVEAYQRMLISYEGVDPAIERNLARLLAAAGGRPEAVPWILKVIGISVLGETGNASARHLLGRYAPDTGSYLHITTPENDPESTRWTEERRFDELVQAALRRIASRGGT